MTMKDNQFQENNNIFNNYRYNLLKDNRTLEHLLLSKQRPPMAEVDNMIHTNSILSEKLSIAAGFTFPVSISYINGALAKSSAEPRNSNIILTANNSTPIIRAIFVCSTNTLQRNQSPQNLGGCFLVAQFELLNPNEFNQSKIGSVVLSMVACYGKGFALCCVPLVAVFEPVTRYRPKASKLQAVTSYHLLTELSAMIYQFIGISRHHYDKTKAEQIRILAKSETQARALKAKEYVLITIGRLPDTAFNANTFNAMGVAYA